MPIKKTGKPLKQQLSEFKRLRVDLPTLVGNEAVNFFKQGFRRQGFIDESFKPWAKRSPKAKRNKGRNILVDSARLWRSIRVLHKVPGRMVNVGTDVPYAQAHNEGFTGIEHVRPHKRTATVKRKAYGSYKGTAAKRRAATITMSGARHNVKGFSRKMRLPQRRIIGRSRFFDRRIKMILEYRLKRILNLR